METLELQDQRESLVHEERMDHLELWDLQVQKADEEQMVRLAHKAFLALMVLLAELAHLVLLASVEPKVQKAPQVLLELLGLLVLKELMVVSVHMVLKDLKVTLVHQDQLVHLVPEALQEQKEDKELKACQELSEPLECRARLEHTDHKVFQDQEEN